MLETAKPQTWAYPTLMALLGISLGVSGAPAPLYGLYSQRWHLAPITTTLVFAAYAVAALVAVLLAGQASDKYGRKPLLLGAIGVMLVGLVLFMTAQDVEMLFVGRILHGAAVGTAVVVGSAALLDLRPADGARTGRITGIVFNIGMAVTILGASLLAQYGPDPFVVPYAVVSAVVAVLLLALVLMVETHEGRTGSASGPIRLVRPQVPTAIKNDFRFAVLGVMASWSVLGVYLSLFPAYAGLSTGISGPVFGGAVVASMATAAAASQALGGGLPALRAAVIGDIATAVSLGLGVLALDSGHASYVVLAAVVLGLSFGLAFGGSLRHLGSVVPAGQRGEVMSAYYVLAYTAMAVPTVLAGAAATTWGIAAVFPWFSGLVALACVAAAAMGLRTTTEIEAVEQDVVLETQAA